jgi:hypothetical protein
VLKKTVSDLQVGDVAKDSGTGGALKRIAEEFCDWDTAEPEILPLPILMRVSAPEARVIRDSTPGWKLLHRTDDDWCFQIHCCLPCGRSHSLALAACQ